MFDLRYITRRRFAYGVLDGQFVILTGYRCDRKTGAFVFTSRIPLSISQATGIETCAPLFRPQVIAGFVDMFGRFASGDLDRFIPSDAPDLPKDDFCPRCGEAPRADGDAVCAACRVELNDNRLTAAPPETTQLSPVVAKPPEFLRYTNSTCPICGKKVMHERRCDKLGTLICMAHCYKPAECPHLDTRISIVRCRYPLTIKTNI